MQKTQLIKRLLAVSVAAAMFGSVGAQAQTANSTQMGASATSATASGTAKLAAADRKAIMDMAMSNMAEVEMGKMAQSKSQNAEVKAFAQKMVDDHGKALTEVQTLAQSKGVTLPTELDAKHKAMAAKLEKANGDAFDKAYTKQGGVAAHKETLAKLQKASKAAKDADVKGQVDKMIPVVQEHLKHAEQVASGKMGSTGSSGAAGHTGASH
jgi:putative membrane protein